MSSLSHHLQAMPVIAILRGVTPNTVSAIAEVIIDAGITVIEVPLNSPDAINSIATLCQNFAGNGIFGCGTCVTLAQAKAVQATGAQIMVTPNTDPQIIGYAVNQGITPIPGWGSVSEAFSAYHAGARYLKLFPASTYGVEHIMAAKAVLPSDANILAVGGVGAKNAAEWFAAGAKGLGIGSELYKAERSVSDVRARAREIATTIKPLIEN